ncbi:hypothetical protein ABOM_000717 [Aspergillus bombycis]|uniref:chitinase n=1 Tax=Aspergillus bombycis TaxID=109264 RepID=A0A1F8AGQ8_9EURO|nr:hypothetical protein ABOM_000717 [Aspergillus bombycis]OGM50923.1 hypothetical protein ABOM_000717 [Aspergillus bombycis]
MVSDQTSPMKRGHLLRVILFGILFGVLCVIIWSHSLEDIAVTRKDIQDGATTESIGSHSSHNAYSRHATRHHRHDSYDRASSLGAHKNHTLTRRDYSCSASNPCSNGACCGATGICGYGPTYCGTGCISQCDAKAECGKYAQNPGETCPLNTCCSEFGFVSDTSGSHWSLEKDLRVIRDVKATASSILSHQEAKPQHMIQHTTAHYMNSVYFAFAFVDPSSYEVVAMDSSTPESLFKETTNIKSIKEDISVFVSIGGWTFSDNGTATQPLLGEIAADETKRKAFANNVVNFLREYGFDGVDFDWEYPGAGDRGGKPEDTANYVLLLKTLRETFDHSGSNFGLTFTAPSSYWYLRWFDLPNMIKYADWINVMTYDLHGVWDSTNPIGSIVQAHTNLTEIKTALELFWRVDIPPAQVVLGIGFYGRAFTLADPSCNTPGCPFSGASKAGPCSNTGGMLAYYEIMSALQGGSGNKRDTITPIHDKEAAVNYFTFDDNQWISYDDKTTFKQKIDWANDIGLGGALIWASDLDDDQYSAHAGLLGREIISTSTLQSINKAASNPKSVIEDLAAFNGQKCFRYSGKCVNLNDDQAMTNACGSGYTVVGWDDAGCGKKNCHCGKPICCPSNAAPKGCSWRGDNTGEPGTRADCSGQCEAGEMNINGIRSSWGGGFTNDGDTDKCGRGYKVFCCPDPDYKEVTKRCFYAECGKDCPSGQAAVLTNYDKCYSKGRKYCCPTPVELTECHWEGGASGRDCANAKCNSTELQIAKSALGDSYSTCDWGRSRAACCTVKKAPTPKAMCTTRLCTTDIEYCGESSYDDDHVKRDVSIREPAELNTVTSDKQSLDKRGGKKVEEIVVGKITIAVIVAAYPSIGEIWTISKAAQVLKKAFWARTGYCGSSVLDVRDLPVLPTKKQYRGLDVEHPIDKMLIKKFIRTAATGTLSSESRFSGFAPIDAHFWQNVWNEANHDLANKPAVGGPKGKRPAKPNERVAEAFGSRYNPYPFMAVQSEVNVMKGKIFELNDPVDLERIKKKAKECVKKDTEQAADELLSLFQQVFAAFEYIRDNQFEIRFNDVYNKVHQQLGFVEETTATSNLQDWWEVWTDDHFDTAIRDARRWARQAIREAQAPFIEAHNNGRHLAQYDRVMAALDEFKSLIAQIRRPTMYHRKTPNPDNGEGPSGYNS